MLLFGYTLLPGCASVTGTKEDRSCFWPLTGRRKHTNKNLYNAPMRLCRVRNWHKGQNWKASLVRLAYTDSSFCFRLMEWEIQACKCNSTLRSSIHSPKQKNKTKENHPVTFLFQKYKVFHKCVHTRARFCWLFGQVMNENAAATWRLVVITALLSDEPGNDFWEKSNSAL